MMCPYNIISEILQYCHIGFQNTVGSNCSVLMGNTISTLSEGIEKIK